MECGEALELVRIMTGPSIGVEGVIRLFEFNECTGRSGFPCERQIGPTYATLSVFRKNARRIDCHVREESLHERLKPWSNEQFESSTFAGNLWIA